MKRFVRVFFLVLDACGIGELPDADAYGDSGSATIPNTAKAVGGLRLPHLEKLGLGKIAVIEGVSASGRTIGAFGRMAEISPGKDSTTGHWEHFGVILDRPFPTYPHGFPSALIEEFSHRSGYGVIGNVPASGTEIIARLGEEHLKTGKLIVYTSADSVFQIAAHESLAPPDELYRICEVARAILTGEHGVGRVIARPFEGSPGAFVRTPRRRDFSIAPPGPFVGEKMIEAGFDVLAIGKIFDIMAGRGISRTAKASGNMETMDKTIKAVADFPAGLVMANLVDFDMLWGHRNDFKAFAMGLEEFDTRLGGLLPLLHQDDLLIITADHGCDPTTPSTDHSREYVPLLVYHAGMNGDVNIGTRATFADTGKTIAEIFGITYPFPGQSFLGNI
ncbi:MAG: phosphopentomutase [candidate division Zixibacteria bacterium]|nr:phosphopentomutase [candidate division Zixibacteria bacterium]